MARQDRGGQPGRTATGEEAIYAARARALGLPFAPIVRLGRRGRVAPHPRAIAEGTFALARGASRAAYLAPTPEAMPAVAAWLATYPDEAARLRVSTPTAIRAALRDFGAPAFLARSVSRLFRRRPDLSAWRVASPGQVAVGIVLLALAVAALLAAPATTLFLANLVAAVFFLGVTGLRFIAARRVARRGAGTITPPLPADQSGLPTYTVLVPLYGEAVMVERLVAALDRLEWPRDRLDIKIIVEEDDDATRERVARAVHDPPYEIVVVPAATPRTKPKALTYALPFARGELVTIYDAEDRPHPRQLREAYAVFAAGGPRLACLQAPIVIDNRDASRIARLFSIEYSALFDGLLPTLADLDLPIPLGGTSNHFRKSALEEVEGWDPFNVTEDADLGIRLARFGYRIGTLTLPTFENAPTAALPWLRQRTRWLKGWMQTWLVHTRQPMRLIRDIGLRQFIGFALVSIGMVISAIIHPIYIVSLIVVAANPLSLGAESVAATVALAINVFNLFAGYIAVALLSGRTLALRRRSGDAGELVWLPFYWLLMSIAGYRALIQLFIRPHHWEKTPHALQDPGPPVSARHAVGRVRTSAAVVPTNGLSVQPG
jgi:cellulose synthase/poly-beta-1,6-N-acetylglucosamine synthase-like glycosyltransferase